MKVNSLIRSVALFNFLTFIFWCLFSSSLVQAQKQPPLHDTAFRELQTLVLDASNQAEFVTRSAGIYWLRINLGDREFSNPWFLHLNAPDVDLVEIFLGDEFDQSARPLYVIGDLKPYVQRPLPSLGFSVPIVFD